MPAGIAALIVTLQPILTNILSGPLLNEKISFKQWVGQFRLLWCYSSFRIRFGIGYTYIRSLGYYNCFDFITPYHIAKKLSSNLPLSVSNVYQAIGGCLFHILIVIIFVEPFINFSSTFLLAMSHQIFLVSFGAFTILMFLIKKNSASKTVSVFFLIPAVSALMGWFFLDEVLSKIDILGFIIASIGVYVATRK